MQDKKNASTIKNKWNLAMGLLAGGAIGAAVGMLFSPRKGTVLRRSVRLKHEAIAEEITEKVEGRIGNISEKVSEKLDTVREGLYSRFGSVRDEFINR